jgi:hypothetical protein
MLLRADIATKGPGAKRMSFGRTRSVIAGHFWTQVQL